MTRKYIRNKCTRAWRMIIYSPRCPRPRSTYMPLRARHWPAYGFGFEPSYAHHYSASTFIFFCLIVTIPPLTFYSVQSSKVNAEHEIFAKRLGNYACAANNHRHWQKKAACSSLRLLFKVRKPFMARSQYTMPCPYLAAALLLSRRVFSTSLCIKCS